MICEFQAVQWRVHPASGESLVYKSDLEAVGGGQEGRLVGCGGVDSGARWRGKENEVGGQSSN